MLFYYKPRWLFFLSRTEVWFTLATQQHMKGGYREAKCYHGSNIVDLNNLSWQKRHFASSKDWRKEWANVLFASAFMHRKVTHVNFFIFSTIFAVPRFREMQKFCYHGNVTWRLLRVQTSWHGSQTLPLPFAMGKCKYATVSSFFWFNSGLKVYRSKLILSYEEKVGAY